MNTLFFNKYILILLSVICGGMLVHVGQVHAATISASPQTMATSSCSTGLSCGLVGYWTFDGKDINRGTNTMIDRSGNGNTATLENMSTTTSSIAGTVGQALRFDGINDAVNAGSGSSLDDIQLQGGGGMTVSFWIRPASNTTKTIMGKAPAAGGTGRWGISKSSATTPARMSFSKQGTVAFNKNYNSLLTIGVWQHIVLTWNGSMTASTGVVVYKNAVLQVNLSATDGSGATSDAAGTLCIGGDPSGATPTICNAPSVFGDEDLDDVRIYNRVISTSEIQQLYNIGLVKRSTSPIAIATSSCSTGLSCGLVGYWTFDGKDTPWTSATAATTIDKSGSLNTGTLANMSRLTSPSSGIIGQGLRFDGNNDYVSKTSPSGFNTGTNPRTISGWVNISASGSTMVPFGYGTCGAGNDGKAFGIYINSSRSVNFWGCGTGDFDTSTTITENRWYLITATYDGTNVRVYLNGVQVGATTARTLVSSSAFWQVGAASLLDSGNYYLNGLVDDVRVYTRALSAREIQQIYSLGAGTKQATSPQVTATSCATGLSCGLVGYWTFDGKDVPNGRANDLSGNGKHANLVNIATSTFYVPGKAGQAFNFDGTDDYVSVGNVSSTVNTISFWIKATDTTKKIIDLNGTASIEVSSGTIVANNFTGATIYVNGVVSSTITANKWYFVTVTTGTAINASAVDIGRISSGYFSGSLDNVRMYNRALSAREVGQLYNIGK